VFVSDPKGQLLDCNDAFVRMLGYSSRDELMALHMDNGVYTSTEQRDPIRIELEARSYVRILRLPSVAKTARS